MGKLLSIDYIKPPWFTHLFQKYDQRGINYKLNFELKKLY